MDALRSASPESAAGDACRICGNAERNVPFIAREMYFGTREEFAYFECSSCGCVQIRDIPADMTRYYPDDYYSFREAVFVHQGGPRRAAMRAKFRLKYFFFDKPALRSLVERIRGKRFYYPFDAVRLGRAGLGKDAAVLDVGCGTGKILSELRECGFRNVYGIDPYIKGDIVFRNGVRITRCGLDGVTGKFDLIILNHSFEHMPDPAGVLRHLARLLAGGGMVVISIPTADSYAWATYRENWFGLDPPRHFHLHTRRSMQILARKAGFAVADVECVSTSTQFVASEQYVRGIPYFADTSCFVNPGRSAFTRRDVRRFERTAWRLNEEGRGDEARYYLSLEHSA